MVQFVDSISQSCNMDNFEQLVSHEGDEQERIRFVYSQVQNSAQEIAASIHRFHITDQKALLGIALAIARVSALDISKHIGNFALADEEDRIKVFLRAHKTSAFDTYWNYDNYKISHPIFQRFAGLEIWNSWSFEGFKKLYFESPYYQKLVYLKCKEWISDAAKLIEKMEIADYDKRFKLAKQYLFAKHACYDFLPKFNINIQDLLPYLRDCAIRQSSFSYYFEIFGITDKTFLYELAILAAENYPDSVAINISRYATKLLYEQSLALLEMVYKENAYEIAQAMTKLGFSPPESLCKKIALLSLQENFFGTLSHGSQFKGLIQTQPINSIENALFDFLVNNDSRLTNVKIQEIIKFEGIPSLIFLKVSHHIRILATRTEVEVEDENKITRSIPLGIDKQIENISWFIKTLFQILFMEGDKDRKGKIYIKILRKIVLINDYDLRDSLAEWCFKVINNKEASTYFLSLQKGKALHLTVPHLLCAYLKLNNVAENKIARLAHAFHKLNKQLKDNAFRVNLCSFVAICEGKQSYEMALDVVLKVFYDEELVASKSEIKKRMLIVVNVANAKMELLSSFLENKMSFETLLVSSFTTSLPIQNIDNFYTKFMQTFGACRQPLAIFQYLASIIRHNEAVCFASLAWFIETVLEDPTLHTFSKERIERNNDHLDAIFKKQPGLRVQWQKMEEYPLSELVPSSLQGNQFVVSEHLKNIVYKDKHIDLEKIDQHSSESIKALIEEVDALSESEKIDRITYLLTDLEPLATAYPTFLDDLYTLIKMIQDKPSSSPKTDNIVMITDNAYDLVLSGTEVAGSCQHVRNKDWYNKGLLGYIADGKIQLAVVKASKEGSIQSRALLRLLQTKKGPVLFLSRFYPANISNSHKSALIKICLIKAKQMNLPLLSSRKSNTKYEFPLFSKGSPAPYEYVDEVMGDYNKLTNGKYEINSAYYIGDQFHNS